MRIILTCTTTGERLEIFYYCLLSLLKQSLKPDLFIVNLSVDEFGETGNYKIPEWMNINNLQINLTEDYKSYKKLIPTLEYASDEDLIITSDDDVIYSRTWLEELVNSSIQEPNLIICGQGRMMKKNIFGRWQNYNKWNIINKELTSINILPIGVYGVVYKKKLLDINFLQRSDFLMIAPGTDDLWFKYASYCLKTKVKVIPSIGNKNMAIQHDFGLVKVNLLREKNSFIGKFLSYIINNIKGYFGINQTRNDRNWDSIIKVR